MQIMLDGTVRVNVGAVEMGQGISKRCPLFYTKKNKCNLDYFLGLNTKMIQIASAVLKVDLFEKKTYAHFSMITADFADSSREDHRYRDGYRQDGQHLSNR